MRKVVLIFGLLIFVFSNGLTQEWQPTGLPGQRMKVVKAAYFDVSKPLREIKIKEYQKTTEKHVVPNFFLDNKIFDPNQVFDDPVSQKDLFLPRKLDLDILGDFDGAANSDNSSGVAPPDTQGDVNEEYFVQAVNNVTVIKDRNGNTVWGPQPTSVFWDGFDGPWTGTNDGDPVVLWDENAQRWLISQFAVNTSDGTQWELVAISTTSDPTGSYYRYAFQFDYMPDYPKLGVWPDGYYLSANAFSNSGYEGTYAAALERDKMLQGDPNARMILFFNDWTTYQTFTFLPTDADVFPPRGTPCYFVYDRDDDGYWTNEGLYVWEFHADWVNTSNSTFQQVAQLSPAAINTSFNTGAPQPGTTQDLDLLNDRMMFRAYYRMFPDHESIVVSRTVNDGGVAAIRWYELRNSNGSWTIYQQGTYNLNDGLWRWMPSIAMNAHGDITIGYSISSSSVYPSIALAARRYDDALNTLTIGETVAFSGSASQTGVSRWGDYAMNTVDPDRLSFWFTTEYTTGSWNWRTRIIHYQLPKRCTPPSVQASELTLSPSTNSVTVSWTRGNGDAVIVLASRDTIIVPPADGTSYTANSVFGSGDQVDLGDYVVYTGTGTSVTVTGLDQATEYYFAVFEYYTAGPCYNYNGVQAKCFTTTDPPSITGITPDNFFADKGAQITITGANLGQATVTLGGVTGTVISNDGSTLVVDFPAANYSDNTLTVTTPGGSDQTVCTVKTRNIIPVGGGVDPHSSITSALDGLFAWWGTSTFDTTKVIEVYSGTYSEQITPNTGLNPTSTNVLEIRAKDGESPVIDATGNDYGFNIGLDYVKVKGFTVTGANVAGIYTTGDYNELCFNRVYQTNGSGIKIDNALYAKVYNNLLYNNYSYGIEAVASDNSEIYNNTVYGNGHNNPTVTGVQVYFEDFETDYSEWRTTTTGSGSWGISTDYYVSPTHSAAGWDATLYNIWAIDVSGYDNIVFKFWMRTSNNLENADQLNVSYSFDNSNWTLLQNFRNDYTPFSQYSYSLGTPASDSLYVRFEAVSTTGIGEYWYVDDVEVTGDKQGTGVTGSGIYLASGTGYVLKNNIITSKPGTDYLALETGTGVSFSSDYNVYYKWTNTNLINEAGTNYADLASWPNAGANDLESDPLFVDTTNSDYHIMSVEGSYHSGAWPPITETGGTWTADAQNSPALDAGDPAFDYSLEPQGGTAINAGAYGNTPQASKSAITAIVWTGTTSSDWNTASNWQNSTLPSSADDVLIPAGCPNYPVIDETVTVNNISVENNASLTITTGGNLTVNTNIDLGANATDIANLTITDGTLTINGALNLNGLSKLTISGGTLSAAAANLASTTTVEYNGTDQDLYNWQYGNLTISGTGRKNITGTAANPTTCVNLTINGDSLVIAEGKALTVTGTLTNNQGTSGLYVLSSTLGDGSLIINNTGVQATVQRYMNGTQWHYISSPVKQASRTMFTQQNFYYWDASMTWGGLGDYTPWISYTYDTLTTAQGYAYYYYTTTLNYQGELNYGTYTLTLHKSASGDAANQGWNLLGNPYSSAIDWDQVVTQAAFTNGDVEMAVYFFDDDSKTGEQQNYRYYVPANGTATGVGTGDASNIIPVGQGFFVKAYTDNVQIQLRPEYRVHNPNVAFYKSAEITPNIVRLKVSDTAGLTDELIIRYVDGATPEFDGRYDARKRFPTSSVPMIYALSPDKSEKMAIYSDDPNTDVLSIPLGFSSQGGEFGIYASEISLNGAYVYLYDKKLDTVVNLSQQGYSFRADSGEFDDRFELFFGKNHPPVLQSEIIAFYQGDSIILRTPEFKDPDYGDSVKFVKLVSFPDWMEPDDDLGSVLRGKATNDNLGLWSVVYQAVDKYGASAKAVQKILILNVNDSPYVKVKIPYLSVRVGDTLAYDFGGIFGDPDPGDIVRVSLAMQDKDLNLPGFIKYSPLVNRMVAMPEEEDVGTYYLKAIGTDRYGLKTSQDFVLEVYKSVTAINGDSGLKLYPDPAKDKLFVELPAGNVINVKVADGYGRWLPVRYQVYEGKIMVNVSGLPSGTYRVVITTSSRTYSHSFIKL